MHCFNWICALPAARELWFNAAMPVAFPTVALIGKYKTPEVAEPVMRLARFLETRGVKVLLDRLTAAHIQNCPYEVLLLEDLGVAAPAQTPLRESPVRDGEPAAALLFF